VRVGWIRAMESITIERETESPRYLILFLLFFVFNYDRVEGEFVYGYKALN